MTDRLANSKRYYQKHLKRERKRRYDYFISNKARWWTWRVKRVYGLSPDKYLELLNKQKGLCKICKTHLETLCIDHNHKTGEVRGLLCQKCNKALGLFGDSVKLLKSAIKYVSNKRN